MIVTIYKPDGSKTRQVTGRAGGTCHTATAPYEVREVPGSVVKTPTADACREPGQELEIEKKAKAR